MPAIEADLAIRWAGYRGELISDYYLQELPEKDYYIFHDLRYPSGQTHFQIDSLILTRYFALHLEIKNISGSVSFSEEFSQIIQRKNDMEKGYQDPISQAARHQRNLKELMKSWGIFDLPLVSLVVFSKPSTILHAGTSQTQISRNVCFAFELLERIESLKKIYRDEKIGSEDIKKLCKNLLKYDTPKCYDPLEFYTIPPSDVITGVQCPACSSFGMLRKHGSWICPKCNCKSKDAHVQAILDYFLLLDSKMSNRKCCEFLHLSSPFIANYLLSTMNLSHSGSNKGRSYFLPDA
jgi:hypothetical protein